MHSDPRNLIRSVPVVVHTYHGHVFHSYFDSLRSTAFLTAERLLGHWSDTLIAVGERQRGEIAAYGIGTANKLVSVPLGLELEPFLQPIARGGLRTPLGLDPSTPLVGIVARLVPVKDHETFLEAARDAVRDGWWSRRPTAPRSGRSAPRRLPPRPRAAAA